MKIAYFDCFSGISGDMILGALIDLGLEVEDLESEMQKLNLPGIKLKAETTSRNGIRGVKFDVSVTERHPHRTFTNILDILDKSDLQNKIKIKSEKVFRYVAEAEAKIHQKDINHIHLHEVAGIDSIVDIVGSVYGISKLGIEEVYSSRVQVGTGFINCQHGTIPVPSPATMEILEGIPTYSRGIEAEMATPTGVAILKAFAKSYGTMPDMTVSRIGYGAGSRDLEIPNLLRICLGEAATEKYLSDEVLLLETNIDNMNPELLGYTSELLLSQGVLDFYMTPISMKKNRPGTMMSIIIEPERLDEVLSTVFSEVSTLGMRIQRIGRKKLHREIVSVETSYGDIGIKVGRLGGDIKSIHPEYEDCKKAASEKGVPIAVVFEEAKAAARKMLDSKIQT